MNAGDKKLNEMNRLTDMGHFPALVNAGATVNILITLTVTWWLGRYLAVHRYLRDPGGTSLATITSMKVPPGREFAGTGAGTRSVLPRFTTGTLSPGDAAAQLAAMRHTVLVHPTLWPSVTQAVLWTALVLLLNVTPVILLRLTLDSGTSYPTLRNMNFVHDQHKFSDWVYLAASANMAFWVLSGWAVLSLFGTPAALVALLIVAALVTFSPVLMRAAGSAGVPSAASNPL